MKYPNTCFAMLALVALAPAGLSSASAQTATSRDPIVITPPAVQNGSNWSRAPFPAARPRDDVRPADGQAIDLNVPPNTPASDPEPNPLPEPTVAIFQTAPAPAYATTTVPAPAYATTTVAEPVLTPTGRTGVAVSLDASQTVAAINAGAYASREQLVADIESRMKAVDTAMKPMQDSTRQMSADGRTQYKAAEDEIKQAERALRNSLRAARRASATEWESARAQLASDFQAYASSVSRLDAAAGIR